MRIAMALLALCPIAARADAPPLPMVWISALEPPWRAARDLPANDYLDLFRADAPWPVVAAHITGVVLSKRFILEAPEPQLAMVVGDLARRHLRVGMQVMALTPTKTCGLGVEGYGPKDDARRAAERVKQAGGKLEAVMLDAPIWFGHFYPGRPDHPACQMSVADVAKQAQAKVAQVRAVFPGVPVGQNEPLGDDEVGLHDIHEALVEYFATMTLVGGRPVSFLQAQVAWQKPGWQEELVSSAAFARTQRVSFGVIYNGGFGDISDATWSAATRRHYLEVERHLALAPDVVTFASASPSPRNLLPETDADTLTGAVFGYLKFHAATQ
jgi:hypothetical protein